jgi:hypothetical protein
MRAVVVLVVVILVVEIVVVGRLDVRLVLLDPLVCALPVLVVV